MYKPSGDRSILAFEENRVLALKAAGRFTVNDAENMELTGAVSSGPGSRSDWDLSTMHYDGIDSSTSTLRVSKWQSNMSMNW
ncbi:hypothetical protein CFAM422_006462 [Trichoderma lentiforme]|uniref:Uncharacterized protein n=1 Tax=Trichoderma lentiforme TaxID=1567552 RepID=A0A9P5CE80_9HYPO|nr:hypothetical protein CFAM422_006462 [Trichoderma lentiforme]